MDQSNEGAKKKSKRNNQGQKRKGNKQKNETDKTIGTVSNDSLSMKEGSPVTPHKIRRTANQENVSSSNVVASTSTQRVTATTSSLHLSNMPVIALTVSEPIMRALKEVMNYEYLTKVQAETLPIILQGKDVLAKSKTGTGKTMAFLLPTLETFLLNKTNDPTSNSSHRPISALVLTPTRELASQIQVEAQKLSTFHAFRVACLVGGNTSINKDLRRLGDADGIDLLVATPGRLHDHLISNNENIVERIGSIKVLVLDEVDHLLHIGFRRDIVKLLAFLPTDRQTLLFSATLPKSLEDIKRLALKKDHAFIDTVGAEEETNTQVDQCVITCPFEDHIQVVDKLIHEHITAFPDCYKIIVFFPTTRTAGFMAQLFLAAKYPILEIYARKSQSQRTNAADIFRLQDKKILFSSDISARGIDYPGVTLVIQVGLTKKEQYIHRLGRTGRAGKGGEGILLLCEFEAPFLNKLNELPIATRNVPSGPVPRISPILSQVNTTPELRIAAEHAYLAWLKFYNINLRQVKMTKVELIKMAEDYSRIIGLDEVPAIMKKTIEKMRLEGMGLRVQVDNNDDNLKENLVVVVPVVVDKNLKD